jgi:hypothetical protein
VSDKSRSRISTDRRRVATPARACSSNGFPSACRTNRRQPVDWHETAFEEIGIPPASPVAALPPRGLQDNVVEIHNRCWEYRFVRARQQRRPAPDCSNRLDLYFRSVPFTTTRQRLARRATLLKKSWLLVAAMCGKYELGIDGMVPDYQDWSRIEEPHSVLCVAVHSDTASTINKNRCPL